AGAGRVPDLAEADADLSVRDRQGVRRRATDVARRLASQPGLVAVPGCLRPAGRGVADVVARARPPGMARGVLAGSLSALRVWPRQTLGGCGRMRRGWCRDAHTTSVSL